MTSNTDATGERLLFGFAGRMKGCIAEIYQVYATHGSGIVRLTSLEKKMTCYILKIVGVVFYKCIVTMAYI